MKPFVALSFILASACAKPQLAHNVTEVAATASHRVAPYIVAVTTHSPAGVHHYTAGAVVPHPVNQVAPSAPAVFTTGHQPAPVVTKHVHLVGTSFVSGSATKIPKPATPHVPIPVPTVLKGSVPYNAPIVKGQIEVHRVQNLDLDERRAEVPCDVPECQKTVVKLEAPPSTEMQMLSVLSRPPVCPTDPPWPKLPRPSWRPRPRPEVRVRELQIESCEIRKVKSGDRTQSKEE